MLTLRYSHTLYVPKGFRPGIFRLPAVAASATAITASGALPAFYAFNQLTNCPAYEQDNDDFTDVRSHSYQSPRFCPAERNEKDAFAAGTVCIVQIMICKS